RDEGPLVARPGSAFLCPQRPAAVPGFVRVQGSRAGVQAFRAQFLKLRGRIACDETHPRSAGRPEADIAVLELIAGELDRSFPLEGMR
ncbi:MAG: hypothetical protein ACKO26_06540, partial [Planctomycetota bacterium]